MQIFICAVTLSRRFLWAKQQGVKYNAGGSMAASAPTRVCSSPAASACRKCCGISRSHNESELKNMEHTGIQRAVAAATRIAITPGWLLMLYFKTHSHWKKQAKERRSIHSLTHKPPLCARSLSLSLAQYSLLSPLYFFYLAWNIPSVYCTSSMYVRAQKWWNMV